MLVCLRWQFHRCIDCKPSSTPPYDIRMLSIIKFTHSPGSRLKAAAAVSSRCCAVSIIAIYSARYSTPSIGERHPPLSRIFDFYSSTRRFHYAMSHSRGSNKKEHRLRTHSNQFQVHMVQSFVQSTFPSQSQHSGYCPPSSVLG